ncbi:MAG: FAD:protein FMN transferase [Sphingomonas sp.]|nr:FAD:protein FMN transferase [Sphingomonas sp.]
MLSRCRPLLGTFVEISAGGEAAIERAYAAVERVHRLMSAHEPESDVSRINRFAHRVSVEVDDWTVAVLRRAQFWSQQSDGAFDVVRAGKLALAGGYLPRPADQPEAQAGNWAELQLDGNTVRLAKAACVDVGGIAKGFAVDRAVEALRSCGADYGLINAGGDLAGFGREWRAAIPHGHTRREIVELIVRDDAVATSGLLPDGTGSHLPDRDATYLSASVRAPTCIDADALVKVLISRSDRASHCLSLVGGDGLVITRSGSIETIERLAA